MFAETGPDVRLVRFVAAEWPGDDPAGQWGRAARRWLRQHPGRSLPMAATPADVDEWVQALRQSLARRTVAQQVR
jgi:hypothetical protein